MSISRWRLRWGLVAVLAAAVAAAVFATQHWPPDHDASIFIVIGRGFLSGRPPFLGLWDDKPPGMYFVGAIAWILDAGNTTLSMRALSVAAIATAATACGWLVSSACSRFWVGVASAIAVAGGLSLPGLSYGGGMTELFAAAGLAVCVATVGGITLGRRGTIWPAAAGGAFAWAIGSSLLSLGAVPALALLWLSIPIDHDAYPLPHRRWRAWIRQRLLDRRLAAAIAGAAAVSLVVWFPVIASGALPAAFDAFTRYNSLYRAAGSFRIGAWLHGIAYFWPLWLSTLLLCLTPKGRGHLLGFSLLRSSFGRVAVLWLVGEMALLVFGQRFYARYLLMIVPPLALLFGFILSRFWLERPTLVRQAVGLVACAAVAFGLGWQSRPGPSYDSQFVANAEVAAYITANSAPDDTIYVWGSDPELYLRSDRQPAGTYFYILPLIMPGYGPEAAAKMLDQWTVHPPRLVVTSRATNPDAVGLYPLVQSAAMTNPLRTYYAALAPLQSFIQSHYDLVATLPIGEVWRYRG